MIVNAPVVVCDGNDDLCPCGNVEVDHTVRGLLAIVGSDTQLPPGWTGAAPGSRGGHHLCPSCSKKAAPDA